MLIPTGFWSYTTSDDASSRGKLSQLRALLAAELQQQVGREPKVNIFQDVAAIPPGAEWERQILESIDTASFIIPIVTPGFLQSEWCCREVTLFREREKQLGASNLVFPVHYVGTENLDGGNRELLKFLRSRQWTDFRHLRFRNLENEEVALLLETFSRRILEALRKPRAVKARQQETAEPRQAPGHASTTKEEPHTPTTTQSMEREAALETTDTKVERQTSTIEEKSGKDLGTKELVVGVLVIIVIFGLLLGLLSHLAR